MRGSIAMLLAIALTGAAALVQARPAEASLIGDPTLTNGAGRFGFGGEADIVLDRDIDPGNGGLDTWRFLAIGSYGFTPTIDGFVKLGLVTGEFDAGPGTGNIDIDPGLAIGVGGKGSFFDYRDFRVGLLAQLLFFSAELDTGGSPGIDWLEVDVAPAVSYRALGQVVPYGGVKLSFVDGDVDGGGDFRQDDVFGIFGGATVALSEQVSVGAELRVLDETAIGFFARFAF